MKFLILLTRSWAPSSTLRNSTLKLYFFGSVNSKDVLILWISLYIEIQDQVEISRPLFVKVKHLCNLKFWKKFHLESKNVMPIAYYHTFVKAFFLNTNLHYPSDTNRIDNYVRGHWNFNSTVGANLGKLFQRLRLKRT